MNNETTGEFNIVTVLKGFVYAVCISIVLILLITVTFYVTPLSEQFLGTVSIAIIFLSVFIGGFVTSKESGSKGLIQGIAVAIIFLLFNLFITLAFSFDGFSVNSILSKVITSLLGGALGGIVGISFANQ